MDILLAQTYRSPQPCSFPEFAEQTNLALSVCLLFFDKLWIIVEVGEQAVQKYRNEDQVSDDARLEKNEPCSTHLTIDEQLVH